MAETKELRSLLDYAMRAPTANGMRILLLGILHGETGADDCELVRGSALFQRHASELGIDLRADRPLTD